MAVEVLLKEMKEIVQSTLRIHGVRAKWRIVPLTYGSWKKLSTERALLDESSAIIKDELKKAIATEEERSELERNDALREKLHEVFRLGKEIGKEYGEEISLDEYLQSAAMMMVVEPYLRPPQAPKRLRGKCVFMYKLAVQNKDADFLILLNSSFTSRSSRRENLITAVHEALHYIQYLSGTARSFESIENHAEGIVNQFLEKKNGF